ncbi:putative dna repair protein swi5 protein [Botrytis fragariae]|uniref:Putative dna repair protein swi5 protein n=1 Tax=Botrytis fragariae TaxID=1964551 RepID=A0A8H6AUA8_9HELO|nr:putative dna repair protein swi5 protein [Botrytis fragariae]KAF5873718.1 putative dna repair protein swi5 protein [Botrytis fragariae]
MDGSMSETDLGMGFIEQWDWQRFREAESMELEDEEDGAMQTQVSVQNGEEMRETTGDARRMRRAGELDQGGLQSMVLPQYDGPADDEDVVGENGSVSKTGIDDIDVRSRQEILLQCDDQAVSRSKTGSGDVDVSSRRDATAASNIPTEEELNKNAPVAQKQRMVAEDVEPYKKEGGVISEKRDDTADEQEDQEMNLAGDKSIPDFPGAEISDQELVKVDESALLEKSRKNTIESITSTTEMAIDSSLIADVDSSGGHKYFEEQIYDKSDDKIKDSGLGSENTASERGNDILNSEKAIIEMRAGSVIDTPIDEENNQIGEIRGNVPTSNTTCSETTVETEMIVDKDANSGNEHHGTEIITSGFLSNGDLRDLEGKPSSISILEQSLVKSAPQDSFSEGVPSIDENIMNAANMDNMPNLTHIQDPIIPSQLPVDDDSLNDVELPSLSRLEAPVQPTHVEIPDSDAITESSQQSPQKLSHNRNTFENSVKYGKNVEMDTGVDAVREENEDAEVEDVMSSFGRECATSSIDPKKILKELEMNESETSQNGIDDFEEIEESAERAPIGCSGKVEEDSRADEGDIDIQLSTTQISPQKPTNRRGQPPGIRRSKMANSQADEEGIESKAMLVEASPDKPMSVEDEEDLSVSSPVAERKKRGRPSTRKISALSFDEHVDKLDDAMKHIASTNATADDSSPNSPAPEKRKRGRPSSRKVSLLSVDELAMEEDKGAVDPPKSHGANKSAETHSSPRKLSADNLYSSSPTPEKSKRGRPSERKTSTLSTLTNDGEDLRREKTLMDEDTIHSNVGRESTDEITANSSSPVKRKRGRPASRKFSGLSPEKTNTEEVTRRGSSNVSVIIPGDIETEQATPSHKSTEKHIAIPYSSAKRKRGRPAGRKSSGIEAEHTEADELSYEASPLPDNDDDVKATTNVEANDDSDESSYVRPKKRGRPDRKTSELNSEKIYVNEAVNKSSRIIVTEETLESIAKESIADVHSTDELADFDFSPVKRKRGRPASRKVSRLSPEKTTVGENLEETLNITKNAVNNASIREPASGTQSVDEPQSFANTSPEKKKRGRPNSRKVSAVTIPNNGSVEPPSASQVVIASQETVAASIDQPAVISSSPEKRKRGRPSNHKSSGVSNVNKDVVGTAEASSSNAATKTSDKVVDADINETAPDASLPVNASPEKRKRGRPARKTSSLNHGNAIVKDMSDDIISSGKNILTEICDSDEEGDALLDDSPPSKKVKPEPRKRGRPSGTKDLGASSEDTKSGDENLTGVLRGRSKSGGINQVVAQIEEKPPASEKKKRGRPSAAKPRRISNSDSDIAEGEQQITDKVELRSIESEGLDEEESDEQDEPVIEKKKRGRPSLLKNKGKQTAKAVELVDQDATISDKTSIAGDTKNKVSGSQISTSSDTSSSQRQDAFLAEIKAMKLTSIQTRNANLRAEIAQKREKIQEITEGLEKPAKQTVKRHIKLLHDYNDIKDVGQGLLGMIADNRGVRVGELYEEFGVGIAD